jgi:hypothetical protein
MSKEKKQTDKEQKERRKVEAGDDEAPPQLRELLSWDHIERTKKEVSDD